MYCKYCGLDTSVDDDVFICPDCGWDLTDKDKDFNKLPLKQFKRKCLKCGFLNDPTVSSCEKCKISLNGPYVEVGKPDVLKIISFDGEVQIDCIHGCIRFCIHDDTEIGRYLSKRKGISGETRGADFCHAKIIVSDNETVKIIEENDTTNHTFVNGRRIPTGTEIMLHRGDTIGIGTNSIESAENGKGAVFRLL